MDHSQTITNYDHLRAELLPPYTGDQRGQQLERAHSYLFETANWMTTAEDARGSNIFLAPHAETSIDTSHVDGPFRHIPVIQGIPRQKSCKQKVISENPTDFDITSLKGGDNGMNRKSTNNELLVCLTPSETIETRPNPNANSRVENFPNSSNDRNRCRVNITTLPGWTKNSETMTMNGKSSSKKKHNLKKRWTKRYHDTNSNSEAEGSPGEILLDSDTLTVLKEIDILKMEHEKLKQQVRLQRRRQKQMRRDIGIIGQMLPVPTMPTEIWQNISPAQKNCE
ncbi:uncharacterized protein LOC117117190 [Anneissia japonica]|uniref:uncharacterized protein LOC117117190 n=1 Tax=Anneissia japonica TaxID=1529436 RepID=UPI001425755E|nr:uncharacterized protein LOC117117190 [Anneissia japonica]